MAKTSRFAVVVAVVGTLASACSNKPAETGGAIEESRHKFTNGGFEAGDLSGWAESTALNPNLAVVPPTSIAQLNLQPGGTDRTSAVSGAVESQIPFGLTIAQSLKFPKYGGWSAVVNQGGNNNNVNRIVQKVTTKASDVDIADGKIHVRFTLAPVLQNPSHPNEAQPYFYVEVRNVTKTTILFSTFNFANQPGVPWQNYGSIQFTDWQLFDIAPGMAGLAIGDEVEVEVIAAGCSWGGHWGEVYLDAFGAFLPGLSVTAQAPQAANAGSDITYTFQAKNGGGNTVDNVIVTENLPANTTFRSLSATGASCTSPAVGATGAVVCNIGTLTGSASYSFTVTVSIASGATGKISNGNYNVKGDGVSPLIGPLVETTITSGVTYANLGITMTNGKAALAKGESANYTIEVTNAGPTPVTGATIVNTIPAELTGVSWTCTPSGTATCGAASGSGSISTTANLPLGDKVTFAVTATVDSATTSTRLTNTATVAAPGGTTDNDTNNNTAVDIDDIGTLYTITLSKGTSLGTGRVVSSPAAIDCGSACTSTTAKFLSGSTISFTATADTGYLFEGWSGPCTGTNNICSFTVTGDATLGVALNPPSYAISSSVTGGNGSISCSTPVYAGGYSTCTITPDAGYVLDTITDNSVDVYSGTTNCGEPAAPQVDAGAPASCAYSITSVAAVHTVVVTFKKARGTTCAGASECRTGICKDGVCCDASCSGQCEACDVAGLLGTCSPVELGGAPHPSREACDTDGTDCGGACDGVTRTNCGYSDSKVCVPASCSLGTAYTARVCDGAGSCGPTTSKVCAPYLCGPVLCDGDCATDKDCAGGWWCAAGVCTAPLDTGKTCTGANQCASHSCVDGVCCDTACGGQCEACDLAGKVGTCSPVGGRPHGKRSLCASDGSACGGTCDGSARLSCSYPNLEQKCREPSCTAGIVTLAAFCRGTGECPAATTQSCAPYECSGTACGGNCLADTDCAQNQRCAAGVCASKLPNGALCGDGKSCASGNCVDGVCCDSACAGQCEACDVANKLGACTPTSGSPHGARTRCTGDGTTCQGACNGTLTTACSFPGFETQCRTPSCTSGVATVAASCDGRGFCPAPVLRTCAPYTCGTTSCVGNCLRDTDCQTGSYCQAGVCTVKKLPGVGCQDTSECAAGVCADGVCCDRACSGQCEACDVPGKLGACSTVTGTPHAGRPACAGSGPCQGLCTGSNSSACTYPTATTTCAPPSCNSGVARAVSTCNGGGDCTLGASSLCGPAGCDGLVCAAGTTPVTPPPTTCKLDADCGDGRVCLSGLCQSKNQLKLSGGCSVGGTRTSDGWFAMMALGLAILIGRRRLQAGHHGRDWR